MCVRQREKSYDEGGGPYFTEHLCKVRIARAVESGMLALYCFLPQTRGVHAEI
jgi:hypothetical protein